MSFRESVWTCQGGIDVGAAGFEPATSCSQSTRASQAALRPVVASLPAGPSRPGIPFAVMAERRSSVGYYVAVVLLAGLLVGGLGLVIAMVARSGPPGASVLAVTDRSPVPCPDHQDHTTCFETQVTNNGETLTGVRCQIRSSDTAQATFVSGTTTTQIVLDTDQSVHLDSIVETTCDAAAHPPVVSCEPASI
jgi:hypothetical protein